MSLIPRPFPITSDTLRLQQSVDACCRVFPILQAQGRVHHPHCYSLMMAWSMFNYRLNSDATLGLLEVMKKVKEGGGGKVGLID